MYRCWERGKSNDWEGRKEEPGTPKNPRCKMAAWEKEEDR